MSLNKKKTPTNLTKGKKKKKKKQNAIAGLLLKSYIQHAYHHEPILILKGLLESFAPSWIEASISRTAANDEMLIRILNFFLNRSINIIMDIC